MGLHRCVTLSLCIVLLSTTIGCAYKGTYTFANTRKLLESDTLGVTKVCASPFVGSYDMVVAPVTIYMDAVENTGENYEPLSYLGLQTLIASDMHSLYKLLAGIMVFPVDTVFFPVTGTIDTFHALARPAGPPPIETAPEEAATEDN